MKQGMLAMGLGLALLWALPDVASAQAGVLKFRFEPTVVIDARPLGAQVLLDGRPVGLAGALTAKAISVIPGTHTVEITAPGFEPYVGRFTVDASGANVFVVTLAPQLR